MKIALMRRATILIVYIAIYTCEQQCRDNPTNLRLTLDRNGKAKASWNHPRNYRNKPSVYKVYYESSDLGKEIVTYCSSSSVLIGPCLPGTTCTVRVQGLSPAESCNTAILGPVTLIVDALLSPPILSVEAILATSARIRIQQPTGSLNATRYRVTAQRLTGPYQPKCPTVTLVVQGIAFENTPFYLTDLEEYSVYKLEVAASFSSYQSSVDNYTYFSTPPAAPSVAPGILSVVLVQPRSISLRWSDIDCVHHNGYLTYVIEYTERKSNPKEIITGSSSTEYSLTNLIPSTDYFIQVAGLTSAGKGPFSRFNITRTLADVPGIVGSLKAVNMTVNSVVLTWRPPQEPNGRIVGYNIQYELHGIIFENITELLRFTIKNVTSGTELNYLKVSAINAAGIGAPVYLYKKLIFGNVKDTSLGIITAVIAVSMSVFGGIVLAVVVGASVILFIHLRKKKRKKEK